MNKFIDTPIRGVSRAEDTVNAFLHMEPDTVAASAPGLLDGISCGVKDVFDIHGLLTGYGNPTWRATHARATRNADAVTALLAAGAHIVGKTHTDELAFSLTGNNHHYGAPVNRAAPGRITGGSSCGSAAAVASGLCDIALGTDTGGSVRAPASFCGLFGIRPTHAAVSSRGVCRLAPSFDTVGWFARDVDLLEKVGQVLLPDDSLVPPIGDLRCTLLESGWATPARTDAIGLIDLLGGCRQERASDEQLDEWFNAFRILQFREVWNELGEWVCNAKPTLGPGVGERLRAARDISDQDVASARACRQTAIEFVAAIFEHSHVLVFPTVPGPAPLRESSIEQMEAYRRTAMRLLCVAGLAGVPQISLPLLAVDGLPFGLSLIGPRGSDRWLLSVAARLTRAAGQNVSTASPI